MDKNYYLLDNASILKYVYLAEADFFSGILLNSFNSDQTTSSI